MPSGFCCFCSGFTHLHFCFVFSVSTCLCLSSVSSQVTSCLPPSCSLTHYVKAVCIFCVFSVASLYQLQELVEAVLENARVSSGCTAARFSRVPKASLCFTHVPSRSRITSLSFHYSSVLSVIIVNISACVLLYILSRHTVFYFGSCTWMHFAVLHINQRKTNTM